MGIEKIEFQEYLIKLTLFGKTRFYIYYINILNNSTSKLKKLVKSRITSSKLKLHNNLAIYLC